jgi:hypothetical protein
MNVHEIAKAIRAIAQTARAEMAECVGVSANGAAEVYIRTKDKLEEIEEAFDDLSSLVRKFKELDVPKTFEAQNVKTITLMLEEEGSKSALRVTTSETLRASIIAGCKPEAFAWLRGQDLGEIIQETVNANTLTAALRERLESGASYPDDLFNSHFQATTSVTKVKVK